MNTFKTPSIRDTCGLAIAFYSAVSAFLLVPSLELALSRPMDLSRRAPAGDLAPSRPADDLAPADLAPSLDDVPADELTDRPRATEFVGRWIGATDTLDERGLRALGIEPHTRMTAEFPYTVFGATRGEDYIVLLVRRDGLVVDEAIAAGGAVPERDATAVGLTFLCDDGPIHVVFGLVSCTDERIGTPWAWVVREARLVPRTARCMCRREAR